MWTLGKSFPGFDAINRGFGGSEIENSTHFADRIIVPHRPHTVLLYAGDNDIAKGKSAARVISTTVSPGSGESGRPQADSNFARVSGSPTG